MLITSIVKEEYERNQKMIDEYENLITELPKGTLVVRKGYYYLKYREGEKVFDKYVGKDEGVILELKNKIALRKHCLEVLCKIKKENKAIQKILEGLK